MLLLAICFTAALLISLLMTQRVRSWALEAGIVDHPDGVRRHHPVPTPRGGGLAVALSVTGVFLACWALFPELRAATDAASEFRVLVIGGAAIFAVGLIDDMVRLTAWTKFLLEIAIAVAVFAAGVRIDVLSTLGPEGWAVPLWLSGIITVVWLVGVTNAFNLIDGSDGVASGAALFAALAIAGVFVLHDHVLGAALALIVAGSVLGFLFYNFPPATIFLGDSGSLFLGYTLAALGVATTHKANTLLAVAIPVVTFGLPILDTLLAMLRRFLRGEPMFKADRGHIHHRLRDLGHSPRKVALLIYAACAAFAFLSLLMVPPVDVRVSLIFLVAGAVLWVGVQRLRIPELVELERLVQRGFRQRQAIACNVRIRDAVGRLGAAERPEDIAGALEGAFVGAEFDHVEVWLPEQIGARLDGVQGVRRNCTGYIWSIGPEREETGAHMVEWRLPVGAGEVDCRLSLFRPVRSAPIFSDFGLIGSELHPELVRAVRAVATGRPRPAKAAVAARSAAGVATAVPGANAAGLLLAVRNLLS